MPPVVNWTDDETTLFLDLVQHCSDTKQDIKANLSRMRAEHGHPRTWLAYDGQLRRLRKKYHRSKKNNFARYQDEGSKVLVLPFLKSLQAAIERHHANTVALPNGNSAVAPSAVSAAVPNDNAVAAPIVGLADKVDGDTTISAGRDSEAVVASTPSDTASIEDASDSKVYLLSSIYHKLTNMAVLTTTQEKVLQSPASANARAHRRVISHANILLCLWDLLTLMSCVTLTLLPS
jgi:hypothetical protein